MTLRRALGTAALIVLFCALTGVGCVNVVTFEYAESVQPLGDHRELAVSTYPAWFPTESISLAPVYVRLRPDEYVVLRFHVRDRKGSRHAGPHIERVHVHRLAYRLDSGPEIVVLADFHGGFWMQQVGSYRDRAKNGIPYREHSVLHVMADLTVNGERFSIAGNMPARQRFTRYPIFLDALGR